MIWEEKNEDEEIPFPLMIPPMEMTSERERIKEIKEDERSKQ